MRGGVFGSDVFHYGIVSLGMVWWGEGKKNVCFFFLGGGVVGRSGGAAWRCVEVMDVWWNRSACCWKVTHDGILEYCHKLMPTWCVSREYILCVDLLREIRVTLILRCTGWNILVVIFGNSSLLHLFRFWLHIFFTSTSYQLPTQPSRRHFSITTAILRR